MYIYAIIDFLLGTIALIVYIQRCKEDSELQVWNE